MAERRFGPFRLERLLGQGGMGEVWLATRPGQPPVALKRLQDQTLATMFEDEARVLSKLRHPGVVEVYALHRDGDDLALEMELLEGSTLHALQRRCFGAEQDMPVGAGVYVGARLAEALSYLHERDIVHRDVAPQNVVIEPDGRVVLLDFGIAWAQVRKTQTAIGVVKGRPAFMAPEQAAGGAADPKADVYALGVLLWELLAGRPLFSRETQPFEALRRPEAPPLRAVRPELPLRISALVQAMLVKDAARRIQCSDCLDVLRAHAGSKEELTALLDPRTGTAPLEVMGSSTGPVDVARLSRFAGGTGPTSVVGPPSGPTTAPEGPLISWSMGDSSGGEAEGMAAWHRTIAERVPEPEGERKGPKAPVARSHRNEDPKLSAPARAWDPILWANGLLFLLVSGLLWAVLVRG
ncbi:MAG: serine/threonine-protein kinase [Myxococcota bacterium]